VIEAGDGRLDVNNRGRHVKNCTTPDFGDEAVAASRDPELLRLWCICAISTPRPLAAPLEWSGLDQRWVGAGVMVARSRTRKQKKAHSMAGSEVELAREALEQAAVGAVEAVHARPPVPGRRIVTLAMLLAMTVTSLEQTVVSTAMPSILA